MKYHRKLQLIKLYSHRLKMIKIHALMLQQENLYSSYFTQGTPEGPPPEEEESDEQQQQQIQNDQFDISNYISSMTPRMRRDFKRNNPQLPDLFFMTKEEKKKFFADINNKFKNKIAKARQRKSKTNKKLSFSKDFQVRGFNENHKVVNISKTKPIRETYSQQIHFS